MKHVDRYSTRQILIFELFSEKMGNCQVLMKNRETDTDLVDQKSLHSYL